MLRDDGSSKKSKIPKPRSVPPRRSPTGPVVAEPSLPDGGQRRSVPPKIAPREPIYLASQLASICDVDLKTIHNWCGRNADPDEPAGLECFRTPGGHLRFRHSAVVRFLNRWGYPIPESLLRDRPHMLLVEPDEKQRGRIIQALRLVRPGEDEERLEDDEGVAPKRKLEHAEDSLGLFANARWYVHATDDPYLALISVGERIGSGAPLDLVAVGAPLPSIDAKEWLRVVRERALVPGPRFAVLTPDEPDVAARDAGGPTRVPRSKPDALRAVLDDVATRWMSSQADRPATPSRPPPGQRKRRSAIAPREPIFVASQVATIWDVDLKTVHNWVERGDIEAFRTPGRHLRFRRRSLLHFLRRYNMAIPEELAPERPRVVVVDADAKSSRKIAGLLQDQMSVTQHHEAASALIELGIECAGAGLIDAVVASFPVEGIDDRRWLAAIAKHDDTRYTRVVVVSGDDSRRRDWQEIGVIATVQRNAIEQVPTVLERALGLAR